MLRYWGSFAGTPLFMTDDVGLYTEAEIAHEYGTTITAAVEDLAKRRMVCDTVIITRYQVLALPKARCDLALTTVFQLPNRIGDTVITADVPMKVR